MKFAYVDITSSIGSLRQFMKIRDTSEAHAEIREKHTVGIPTLVVDDAIYRVSGPEHAEQLIEELHLLDEAE